MVFAGSDKDKGICAKILTVPHVNRAIASLPGCTHSAILARNAYDEFLRTSSSDPIPASSVSPRLGSSYAESLSAGFVGL